MFIIQGLRCLGQRTVEAILTPALPYLVELVCLAIGKEDLSLTPDLTTNMLNGEEEDEHDGENNQRVVHETMTLLIGEILVRANNKSMSRHHSGINRLIHKAVQRG